MSRWSRLSAAMMVLAVLSSCGGDGAGESSSGMAGAGGASVSGSGGGVASGSATGGSGGASSSTGTGGMGGMPPMGWSCPPGPFGNPLPANPMVQRVQGVPPADGFSPGYGNVEGPVWIGDSLYASHIAGGTNPPPSRILKIAGTAVTVFAPDSGTNGLAVDPAGKLVGARHSDGSVSFIDLANPTSITPIAAAYMGVRFNSPNDLAIRSDGNIYFSDPEWQAPQPPPQGLNHTRVYRIDPSGNVSVVAANLDNPNGVTLSVDENTLWVSGGSGLWKYPVSADGTTGAGISVALFLTGTDGMGMDCAGNLYVTQGKSVLVLDAGGTMIGNIAVNPPGNVTNVAFGGPDRKTLFITALGNDPGLWTIDLQVPGLPY